jgi:fructokinase
VTHLGGIELGGTKTICAIGDDGEILERERFPTTTPDETLGRAADFFQRRRDRWPVEAVGIAAFGPLDLDPESPTYGSVVTTPKTGWSGAAVSSVLGRELDVPVAIHTDVVGAAIGEWRWGAARDVETVLYVTVGTGIGGGLIVRGQPILPAAHAEMGHLPIPREAADRFAGHCPFHGDCLEGLASGPAMEARWGRPPTDLPPDHEGWSLEALYLARAVVAWIYTVAPDRIVLGGGVGGQLALVDRLRDLVPGLLAGYADLPARLAGVDRYLVPPGLGADSGVLGALALAERATR